MAVRRWAEDAYLQTTSKEPACKGCGIQVKKEVQLEVMKFSHFLPGVA
jgi:hypothetical protein